MMMVAAWYSSLLLLRLCCCFITSLGSKKAGSRAESQASTSLCGEEIGVKEVRGNKETEGKGKVFELCKIDKVKVSVIKDTCRLSFHSTNICLRIKSRRWSKHLIPRK